MKEKRTMVKSNEWKIQKKKLKKQGENININKNNKKFKKRKLRK